MIQQVEGLVLSSSYFITWFWWVLLAKKKKKSYLCKRWVEPNGRNIIGLLNYNTHLSILITNYTKGFCGKLASKFKSSLILTSCSCKLIRGCSIFIILESGLKVWKFNLEHFKQVRKLHFQLLKWENMKI